MSKQSWDRFDELGRSIYEDEELQNEFCNYCGDLTKEWDTGEWVCRWGAYLGDKNCYRIHEWEELIMRTEHFMQEVRALCRN